MSKRVEIIIGEYPNYVSLDLTEDSVSIALQYNIDDVRNIEKKNTNHSKTITLAGTKTNNKAFGNLFDVNADFTKYNPNKKVNARIVVDSSPVLEGHLKLIKVNKDNLNSLQGSRISYDVVVFDKSVDFFQSLGDKELTDLDLTVKDSNNNYIYKPFHDFDEVEIQNAWNNHTYTDLYQYPLLDNANTFYQATDFKPCFYYKGLLNVIASERGYTLEGSFMNNPTFENELISYDGSKPLLPKSVADERQFNVGMTGTNVSYGSFSTHSFLHQHITNKIRDNVNYNDLTSTGFNDNNGNFTSNHADAPFLDFCKWVCPNSADYNFKLGGRFKVSITANNIATIKKDNNKAPFLYIKIDLKDQLTGNVLKSSTTGGFLAELTDFSTGLLEIEKDLTIELNDVSVSKGMEVKPVVTLLSDDRLAYEKPSGNIQSVNIELEQILNGTDQATINERTFFSNECIVDQEVQYGEEISVASYLPKGIKQKDLFFDLIKRYNIYIRTHSIKENTLILETRDDYYNSGEVVDWTQKKDYNSNDNIKFLTELQKKEMLFSYNKDGSGEASNGEDYGKIYTKGTTDVYGQKEISFDNDFVKGTKKIESIFSTSPLIFNSDSAVIVPSIDNDSDKVVKPSILLWGGMIPVSTYVLNKAFLIGWNGNPLTGNIFTTYPYAGHYDNPYAPTVDINFGQITYSFYGEQLTSQTANNLFNKYWRNYINQISDGKLIISKFYLKETDINFIKDNLNSRIFVKDSYYIVNKIIDYTPLKDGLTTVELLQIQEGTEFDNTGIQQVVNNTVFNGQTTNTSISKKSKKVNKIKTRSAVVTGSNNDVSKDVTGIINGNNNTIQQGATNINVQGNNNYVDAGLTNVVIVGDNQTVTESNTTLINGVTIQNGVLSSDVGKKEITLEIGSWDMTSSTTTITVPHGLSSTEWLTVSNLEVNILDDNSSALFRFADYETNRVFTTPSVFVIELTTGSTQFNTTDFNDSTINRGFIYFSYTQD